MPNPPGGLQNLRITVNLFIIYDEILYNFESTGSFATDSSGLGFTLTLTVLLQLLTHTHIYMYTYAFSIVLT